MAPPRTKRKPKPRPPVAGPDPKRTAVRIVFGGKLAALLADAAATWPDPLVAEWARRLAAGDDRDR